MPLPDCVLPLLQHHKQVLLRVNKSIYLDLLADCPPGGVALRQNRVGELN
jgi:hypothetical protein